MNLIIKYARSADHADIFNFASMAHNNDFFFQGMVWFYLSPPFTGNPASNSVRIPEPRPRSNATRTGRVYPKILLIPRVLPLDLHRDRKRDVRPRLRLAHEEAVQRARHPNDLYCRNALPKGQLPPTASRHEQHHDQHPTHRVSIHGFQENRCHQDHIERPRQLRRTRRILRARQSKCSAMVDRGCRNGTTACREYVGTHIHAELGRVGQEGVFGEMVGKDRLGSGIYSN